MCRIQLRRTADGIKLASGLPQGVEQTSFSSAKLHTFFLITNYYYGNFSVIENFMILWHIAV